MKKSILCLVLSLASSVFLIGQVAVKTDVAGDSGKLVNGFHVPNGKTVVVDSGGDIYGTAPSLTAGAVTNANLTGEVTTVGNVATLTNSAVIGKVLTGYVSGAGTVSATDSILQAVQKLNGNVAGLTTGVSSVFGRTGAVTATSGDYNTSQVTENTNLYFTDARTIAAPLTGYVSGAGTVSSSDSILQAIQKLGGNDALYLPLTGGTLSGNLLFSDSGEGVLFNGGGTISGSSGALTFSSTGSGSNVTLDPSTTGSVVIPFGNLGLRVYNTADQTTNYERLEAVWSGNTATIRTTAGGTGSLRNLNLSAPSTGGLVSNFALARNSFPFIDADFTGGANGTAMNIYRFRGSGTVTSTSGTSNFLVITPTYNQASGTAANTDLLINRTETAVGSGVQNLIDAQVGGSSKFRVANSGTVVASGSSFSGSSSQIGFSSRSRFYSDSDGLITLTNSALTNFSRLQFGGTTSSFPAFKRNATSIQVRLADDSNYAPFKAGLISPLAVASGYILSEEGQFCFDTDYYGVNRGAMMVRDGSATTAVVATQAADSPGDGEVPTYNSASGTVTWETPAPALSAANPTASVGLTAVNGSASTYMRSDAAPAISQSIAPTWTGKHSFDYSGSGSNIAATISNGSDNSFTNSYQGQVATTTSNANNFTGLGSSNAGGRLSAVIGTVSHAGTGDVSLATAFYGKVSSVTTTGSTMTNAGVFKGDAPSIDSGKTISSYKTFWAQGGSSVTGTLTNWYGVYVEANTSAGANWGIYDAGNPIYFGASAVSVANIKITSGSNAKSGTFTLSSGSATVGNTSITANSVIVVTVKTVSGTRSGNPDIVPTASTGFTATGAATDNSTYNYAVLEVN